MWWDIRTEACFYSPKCYMCGEKMDLYVQSVAKNNGLYSICMLSVVYSAAGRLGYQEGKGKENPLAKLAPDLPKQCPSVFSLVLPTQIEV